MYIATQELTRTDSALYGLCSCGAKFILKSANIDSLRGASVWKAIDFPICPRCGARYSTVFKQIWCEPRHALDKSYGVDLLLDNLPGLVSADLDGPYLTINRELVDPDHATGNKLVIGSTSSVKINLDTGSKIVEVYINGERKKVNKSNIAKAMGHISSTKFLYSGDDDKKKAVSDKIKFFCNIIGTSSLATGLSNLFRYPVVDALFNECGGQNVGIMYQMFSAAIDKHCVEPGVSSIKAAFGVNKAFVPFIVGGTLPIETIHTLIQNYGTDTTETVLKTTDEILGRVGDDTKVRLFKFLESRTPEERQRLKSYLTEEVAMYQGIENPREAATLLLDYINMCQEMEVGFELCPKSLKLRHDLARRNYNLVLDDIQKRKFREIVEEPRYSNLAWTSKDKKWTMLVPQNPEDLVREGNEQSHCVGSYVNLILSKSLQICFLRKTEDVNKPVLTVTVSGGDTCSTYLGFGNREAMDEEIKVLEEWTKVKRLKLEKY